MILFPKMPNAGTNKISGIYNTVRDIVNLLPKLAVVGDNKTTFVEHSPNGTMVRAKPVTRGGISAGGDVYNGPFNMQLITKNDKETLHIKGGLILINGQIKKLNDYDVQLSSITNAPCYCCIRGYFEKGNKKINTQFAFLSENEMIRIEEFVCKFPIGMIVKNSSTSTEIKCYEIAVPVLTIGGECDINDA